MPIAFDNPSVDFHRCCLQVYDRSKSGRPILNSVAASRERLDEMLELVADYDTLVVGMASEKFVEGGSAQCSSAGDVHGAARRLVDLLVEKAGRTCDQIIIDPGLAPVGADTYGLVNMSLDAMRRIRSDASLRGVHLSVGLTNFSFGVPKDIREGIESAYLTLAVEAGLDFVLANPEKQLHLLDAEGSPSLSRFGGPPVRTAGRRRIARGRRFSAGGKNHGAVSMNARLTAGTRRRRRRRHRAVGVAFARADRVAARWATDRRHQCDRPLADASIVFDATQIHEVTSDGARPTTNHLAPGQSGSRRESVRFHAVAVPDRGACSFISRRERRSTSSSARST